MHQAAHQHDPLAGCDLALRNGVRLRVSHHPADGPPLVFLHGALGNRFNWRRQVEFALHQRWEVLAYDLAGHGDSSPYDRYSIGRHRRDLGRLLTHFGIRRPILCCHSYGVPVGLEWARRHGVRGLVLIAGGTHDLAPWWEPPLLRAMHAGGRHLLRLGALQRLQRHLAARAGGADLERHAIECPLPAEGEPYRSMASFHGYDFRRRPAPCHWQELPALIVSAGRDPFFSREMAERLREQFPRARHLHLRKAGHLVMVERVGEVNGALAGWIRDEGLASPRSPQPGRR